jgi:hypothetical protein
VAALIGERADLTLEEIRGLLDERGVRVGVRLDLAVFRPARHQR